MSKTYQREILKRPRYILLFKKYIQKVPQICFIFSTIKLTLEMYIETVDILLKIPRKK